MARAKCNQISEYGCENPAWRFCLLWCVGLSIVVSWSAGPVRTNIPPPLSPLGCPRGGDQTFRRALREVE